MAFPDRRRSNRFIVLGADLEAYFDFAEKSNAMKYSLDTGFWATTHW